jgi:hypothetical protein
MTDDLWGGLKLQPTEVIWVAAPVNEASFDLGDPAEAEASWSISRKPGELLAQVAWLRGYATLY